MSKADEQPPFRPLILEAKKIGGDFCLWIVKATLIVELLSPPISVVEMGGCPQDRGAALGCYADGHILSKRHQDFILSFVILR